MNQPRVICSVTDRHLNFQTKLLATAMSEKFEVTVLVRQRVHNREIAPGFELVTYDAGPTNAMAAFAGGYFAALDDVAKYKVAARPDDGFPTA